MTRLAAGKSSKPSQPRHRFSPRGLVLRRLEEFSQSNSIVDVNVCVEHLRRKYRNDYSRMKQDRFYKLVDELIQEIKLKQKQKKKLLPSPVIASPSGKKQSLLELQEEQHSRQFRRSKSCNDSDDSSDDDDDDDDEDGGSDDHDMEIKEFPGRKRGLRAGISRAGSFSGSSDEDEVLEPDSGFNLLNASLCNIYSNSVSKKMDTTEEPSNISTEEPRDISAEESGKLTTAIMTTTESTPRQAKAVPAFAPPQEIIAAAARAANKVIKKTQKLPEDTESNRSSPVTDLLSGTDTQVTIDHSSDGNNQVAVKIPESSTKRPAQQSILKNETAERSGPRKRIKTEGKGKGKGKDKDKDEDKDKDKALNPSTAEAVSFSDLGGIDSILGLLREIMFPLYNPGIYSWLGLQPIRGVLLHGPPGCGKTKLANAIAHETGLPFLRISGPEVVSGMSGESEAKIRSLFAEATRIAPCVVFIDEIDSITSKRENAQREMERRIVTQLMTCMDELNHSESSASGNLISEIKSSRHVLVIGATNRPEALDPALRRPGRFDHEILLGVPDENGRAQILSVLAKNLRLEGSFDFKHIARCTPGFVGADLAALTREAGALAIKRIVSSRDPNLCMTSIYKSAAIVSDEKGNESPSNASNQSEQDMDKPMETTSLYPENWWKIPWSDEEMHQLSITMQDFEEAVAMVQPSTKREGFSAIPNVKWEDVGALGSIQKMMEFFISRRIKHPEDYEVLGLDMDTGFLLYGPPGCGKTLVAKAVANDAQANFIYIKGPELLNKYVGESEQAVRALFSRARSCAPCILFFDEMDALAPRRGTDGNAVAERVLNQLLSEMDGAEKRKGVFMVGATNRPDMIDPAVLRPGRLGKLLYIPLPNFEGRISILKTLTMRKPISPDVDLALIAATKQCEGLSGADLAALVNEACVAALQEKCTNSSSAEKREPLLVNHRHFEVALTQISPSVSKQDLLYYEALPKKFNRSSSVMKGIACEAPV